MHSPPARSAPCHRILRCGLTVPRLRPVFPARIWQHLLWADWRALQVGRAGACATMCHCGRSAAAGLQMRHPSGVSPCMCVALHLASGVCSTMVDSQGQSC